MSFRDPTISRTGIIRSIDRAGQRFGRLVVVRRTTPPPNTHVKATYWLCRCDCGVEKTIQVSALRSGGTQSCGCLHREGVAALGRLRKGCPMPKGADSASHKHGYTRTPTYSTWSAMYTRCFNSKSISYKDYGAKGITICERWRTFENFFADMGEKPRGLSIDRIDVSGNYEPSNCRWATNIEQARNKRTNRLISAFGETKTLSAWAESTGLSRNCIEARIDRSGWSVEDALTRPRLANKAHTPTVNASGE